MTNGITTEVLKEALWANQAIFVHRDHGAEVAVMLHKIEMQWAEDKTPEQIHEKQVNVLLGFLRYTYDQGVTDGLELAAKRMIKIIKER